MTRVDLHGLQALLPLVEGNPLAMAMLARRFAEANEKRIALDLCRRALVLTPGDAEIAAIAAEVMSASTPRWHFNIVRDQARNDAFESAIRRAVWPGCKVLEIGTGSGLLAMMAARAGAGQVVTCEGDAAVAEAAQSVVAHNGYADRVRVVAKHSASLDLDADLGGPADILISETFSNDTLGEGALDSIENAIPKLLKPDGVVIPQAARVRVALVQYVDTAKWRAGTVSGFDLSPFNRLARPRRRLKPADEHLTLRSPAVDLLRFDFRSGHQNQPSRNQVVLEVEGPVNGVAQWLALDMDQEGGLYENAPAAGRTSSWAIIFHDFPILRDVPAGGRIAVHGAHDRKAVRLWAKPAHD